MTREEAYAVLAARIRTGTTFSTRELCKLIPESVEGTDGIRIVDSEVRRWRRKGLVSFQRVGQECFWDLTPAGKKHVASEAKAP